MSTSTPSVPSATDHDKHGGESDTQTSPEGPPTEASEDKNEPSTSESEPRDIQERLREMESKMESVDKLYNLHQSTVEAMEFSNEDPVAVWNRPGLGVRERVAFYTDVVFFMRKLRESHQKLAEIDRMNMQRRETFKKVDSLKEDDNLETLSFDAFKKGRRIKPTQKDWQEYLFPRTTAEEALFTPIEVISSEPDSKMILQMDRSGSKNTKGDSPKRLPVERIPPTIEDGVSFEHQPLPERVWVRSMEVVAIIHETGNNSRTLANPPPGNNFMKSRVFLRPYQALYYREKDLRDWLAVLEKRFENPDNIKRLERSENTKPSSSPSRATQKDGITERERADSDPIPSALETTQSNISRSDQADQEAHSSQNKIVGNEVVDSSVPTERLEDKAGKDDVPKGDVPKDDARKTEAPEDGTSEDDTPEDKHTESNNPVFKVTHSITALLHLRCLMEFIDKELKPKQEYISSSKCTRIHFHDLWHLFKPGDEIIQQDGKQAFIVLRVQVPRHRVEDPWNRWNHNDQSSNSSDSDSEGDEDEDDDNDGPFTIHCAYIDFDGKYFGAVSKRFRISPFDEPKPIKSLPVYPLRFLKETQARQELIERGQMLLEVSRFKAMYYTGVTLDTRDEIDSQVVIDFSEAFADDTRREAWEPTIGNLKTSGDRLGSKCDAICCEFKNINEGFEIDSKMTEDYVKSLFPETTMGVSSLILQPRTSEEVLKSPEKLTETELLIMTYRVFGFVLRSRKWAQLDLSLLRHENANARLLTVNAFDRLELPDNHREVLKSLVVQHFRSKQSAFMKNEQTDLVQGKGKGLILLLHGAPGVGKTTTAEGIAQLFRKPLFQITCGDLGTTAGEVEAELEKNFSLASRWGCILLLDEADVFLSAREKMDFKRNGLVAVFLRVLEYYSGILFLTTNRIGDFDEAFSSRIHMSLYYPPLNEEKTLKVFQLNLDLIKRRFIGQGRSITFDASAVEKFARDHFRTHKYNRWNGRQIRNACQTALALAEFDSQGGTLDIEDEMDKTVVVELQQKYFETVQKAYLAFDEYLGDIQGTQGDSRAIDYKLRARTDTPYQNKRNAFQQHESYSSQRGQQNLRPEYPHAHRTSSNMSQTNYGSQGDPFDQSYTPATPNANMSRSQSYEPNPSHASPMNPYQGQSRGGPASSRDMYDRSTEGNQQYQAGHRSSQGGPKGQQFEPSRVGNRVMSSIEDGRYPSPGYDDSPRPYRGSQRQPQGYDYDHPDDGGIA